MIHLRAGILLFLAFACVRDTYAATTRFRGFPSRQQVAVIRVAVPPPDLSAKLPPPTTPAASLPSDVEIETTKTPSTISPSASELKSTRAAKPDAPLETEADILRNNRIKSERERLNRNAVIWQQQRAEAGSATAQRSLAMRYLTGDGLERDDIKGMILLRKAAIGGDSAAQKELGKREPPKKE